MKKDFEGLPRLKAFVQRLAAISEEDWQKVLPLLSQQTFEKNELFVRIGESKRTVGFITEGIVRKYYLDQEGEEFTNGYAAENQLAAPYEVLLSGKPSEVNLQAVVKTHLITFKYDEFQNLAKTSLPWREVALKVAEYMLLLREKRQAQMLMKSASERYEEFMKEYPTLVGRVPNYQIASFIGITPEALSRLRKK